jgi:hypothetical protein
MVFDNNDDDDDDDVGDKTGSKERHRETGGVTTHENLLYQSYNIIILIERYSPSN